MTTMTGSSRIITFRLGDDLFAADIFAVERVLRYDAPRAIPNVPDWIRGVIEYQGRVVPVVDLRRRFGLPEADVGPQARMLVLSSGGEWVAVIVDLVLDVRPLEEAALSPPPALFRGLAGEYLRGLTRRGESLVVVLDVDRLLSSQDRLVLAPARGADA